MAMTNFTADTLAAIPGNTPREKFVNLNKMLALLELAAYPKRGTWEEKITIQDIAEKAMLIINEPQ